MATGGNDDFFKEDTPHGLVKRFMWKRHVQTFIAMTQHSKWTGKTIIFDGFAGAGRYGRKTDEWPKEIEKYGSPLISLRAAIDFHASQFRKKTQEQKYTFSPSMIVTEPPSVKEINYDCDYHNLDDEEIQLYFVEKNEKNFNKLVSNVINLFTKYQIQVKTSATGNEVYVISCDENIPVGCKITMESFENVKAPDIGQKNCMVSFIDPFGYTQIPMSKITQFMGKRKEVFINLMSQHVNRFKNVGRDGLKSLFGLDYEDICGRLEGYEGGAIEKIAKLYVDVLEEKTRAKYRLSFEMRNKGNVPLFHMIFATDHEQGLISMKEAMNRGTQSQDSFSLSDFLIIKKHQEINLGNGQNDDDVANTIYEEFKGTRKCSYC